MSIANRFEDLFKAKYGTAPTEEQIKVLVDQTVISNHQSGGITAHTVNVKNEAPAPEVVFGDTSTVEHSDGRVTHTLEMDIVSLYPPNHLKLTARGEGVEAIDIRLHRTGMLSLQNSGERENLSFTTIMQPYGRYTLTIVARGDVSLEYCFD